MNPNKQSTFFQTGFSLVEIMVGLVIGLLASLVIMQVFSGFEAQKRSTSGTANAQTNGNIALYTIQRDLQMAGYGLLPTGVAAVPDSAIECTSLTIEAATLIGDISPVTITDGGVSGGSDTLTIRYSSSNMGGIPVTIRGVAANVMSVDSNMNCRNPATATPEIAIVINGNACFLTAVTALSAPADLPPATITLRDASGAAVGAGLACLGTWNENIYRVNNGNLERNGSPTVADIVNIQAQYGIGNAAAANPNRVVQWVNATGATWAAPTPANRNLIKAVRVAVVARNGSYEKTRPDGTDVTNSYAGKACSSLTSDAPTGVCAWSGTSAGTVPASDAPAIDLSNDPDWQHYRYRVFETIIPMRNVIWSRSTL